MTMTMATAPTISPTSLPWQRVLIIGMGHSGKSAAKLAVRAGLEVYAYDRSDNPPDADLPPGIQHFRGQAQPPPEAFAGIDALILSPGLDPRPVRTVAAQYAASAEVLGELSLAFRVAEGLRDDRGQLSARPRTILVTGTNGKSTVTSLTHALLESAGLRSFAGGNLGIPLCDHLLDIMAGRVEMPDAWVIECSSYQLETATEVACDVAMVLNVSPDHLDRYDSIDHYAHTKAKVFAGLKPDGLALLDHEDPFTPDLRARVPSTAQCREIGQAGAPTLSPDAHELRVGPDESYPRDALTMAGRHNARNALFAIAAARHLGATPEHCLRGLQAYRGLPHRMAEIATIDDVVYYDDSKATNVAGVLAGLDGFARRVVLIAGGRAKQGDDLSPLRALMAQIGRGLVATGESAESFMAMADAVVPAKRAANMVEAVRAARELAQPGDAVVLSPACASWDQYRSFAHRGEVFAQAVEDLRAT